MAVQTITTVFASTPASTDSTNIQSDLTTLLARLDTAVTNGKLNALVRDVLHDNLVTFSQEIAKNLNA